MNNKKPHIWSLPIIFRFSCRKSQIQQKNTLILQYSFAQQPHSFYEQKYTPATQPKICFWLMLDTQELHSRNTW